MPELDRSRTFRACPSAVHLVSRVGRAKSRNGAGLPKECVLLRGLVGSPNALATALYGQRGMFEVELSNLLVRDPGGRCTDNPNQAANAYYLDFVRSLVPEVSLANVLRTLINAQSSS